MRREARGLAKNRASAEGTAHVSLCCTPKVPAGVEREMRVSDLPLLPPPINWRSESLLPPLPAPSAPIVTSQTSFGLIGCRSQVIGTVAAATMAMGMPYGLQVRSGKAMGDMVRMGAHCLASRAGCTLIASRNPARRAVHAQGGAQAPVGAGGGGAEEHRGLQAAGADHAHLDGAKR